MEYVSDKRSKRQRQKTKSVTGNDGIMSKILCSFVPSYKHFTLLYALAQNFVFTFLLYETSRLTKSWLLWKQLLLNRSMTTITTRHTQMKMLSSQPNSKYPKGTLVFFSPNKRRQLIIQEEKKKGLSYNNIFFHCCSVMFLSWRELAVLGSIDPYWYFKSLMSVISLTDMKWYSYFGTELLGWWIMDKLTKLPL